MTREEMGRAADAVNKEAHRNAKLTMKKLEKTTGCYFPKSFHVGVYLRERRKLLGL